MKPTDEGAEGTEIHDPDEVIDDTAELENELDEDADEGEDAGRETDETKGAADDIAAAGRRRLEQKPDPETSKTDAAGTETTDDPETDDAAPDADKDAAGKRAATPDGKEKVEKVEKLVLAGVKERGEDDIEVEVDPELAERIKRLQNDGMRRRTFEKRMAQLEERDAHYDAIDLEAEQDPVGFLLGKVPKERQLQLARALVIEHFEALVPDLDKFGGDAAELYKAQRDLRDTLKTSGDKVDTQRQARAMARSCVRVTETLIPETADETVAARFLKHARAELADAVDRGELVSAETTPKILVDLIKLYGFDKKAPAPKARVAATSSDRDDDRDRARPLSARARELAGRRPAKEAAQATQTRLRRTQQARDAARRVAPTGATSTPVQRPALKEAEQSDVRSASAALRKRGLRDGWGSRAEE